VGVLFGVAQHALALVGGQETLTLQPKGEKLRDRRQVPQRQLLSFARAFVRNPSIVVLDEATSSVDTQTERTIQNALARLLRGRTAFVIAHRLSTVVSADHIVVIHLGQIVEQGTHEELLARRSYYFHLYSLGFED